MSIESDLRKDGITVIETLDNSSVTSIAQNVSRKIYSAFPNIGFSYEELFEKLSHVPMYIANIPNGMSEASYFYKNSSIYFRDGMGLTDIEKYSIHEFIHNIQERKDNSGNLLRLGLCEFSKSKIIGMALNEAAVQIITSNILNYTFESVEYYGLNFSTISPNIYPLLCNIVTQMAYVTGEEALFDSTFNSNDRFKNKFIALCGNKSYSKILNNLDKLLNTEETIIKYTNILQSEDLSASKVSKIMAKIDSLKATIQQIYFSTQELIISSYFSTLYSSLLTTVDIEAFRKNLYNFQELIGTSSNYYFFSNFYINMMEKLDLKYDIITGSTYLIPRKDNKFIKVINYIKTIIFNHELAQNRNTAQNKNN